MPKPKQTFDSPRWTDEEVRYLAKMAGSPQGEALRKAMDEWRLRDRAELLSHDTPFERTQFVRGRLSLLQDLVLLLEQDAPARYESILKSQNKPDSETT